MTSGSHVQDAKPLPHTKAGAWEAEAGRSLWFEVSWSYINKPYLKTLHLQNQDSPEERPLKRSYSYLDF